MSRWTRANPLAAVPGYNVPRGHFANGYTNGGDRVNFKVGGRVGLKRGGGRTERQGAASELHRAKARSNGSHWTTTVGGFPIRSDWHKAQKKHKKDYPKLVRNIKYDVKKLTDKAYEEGPRYKAPRPGSGRVNKRKGFIPGKKPGEGSFAKGGRIELKKGGSPKNWIQKAVNPKHKGFCTPMTKKTCTPRRKALARTFKKMGRARKGKA